MPIALVYGERSRREGGWGFLPYPKSNNFQYDISILLIELIKDKTPFLNKKHLLSLYPLPTPTPPTSWENTEQPVFIVFIPQLSMI